MTHTQHARIFYGAIKRSVDLPGILFVCHFIQYFEYLAKFILKKFSIDIANEHPDTCHDVIGGSGGSQMV